MAKFCVRDIAPIIPGVIRQLNSLRLDLRRLRLELNFHRSLIRQLHGDRPHPLAENEATALIGGPLGEAQNKCPSGLDCPNPDDCLWAHVCGAPPTPVDNLDLLPPKSQGRD